MARSCLQQALAPTIYADANQPLRCKYTPEAEQKQVVEVEESDKIFDKTELGFKFTFIAPDTIECDYWGSFMFKYTKDMHVHAVIQNPLKSFNDLKLGNSTTFHFKGDVGKTYNEMVMGMIYQWKISSLEVLHAVVDQGHFPRCEVNNQLQWINNNVA